VKKTGGGLGFVIAILALVILLLLTARAWNSVLPAAKQALRPGAAGTVPDHGQTGAGEAIRSGGLPDLKQMNRNTDQHIRDIKDNAKEQD
jgi:hypothetical protein